jgi:nucleotide-binding universal stress UspA family protein
MYTLDRILVPTDFSTHATAALEHAVLLGSRFTPEYTLLHADEFAVSPLGALGIQAEFLEQYHEGKLDFLRQQFTKLTDALREKHLTVRTQIVPGRSYRVIIEESEKADYDLIVIATRGLTHLSPHLIGSTAERVVRLSRQPVLTVHGPPVRGGKLESVLCPTDLSVSGNVALSYALSIARQYGALLYIQYISELEKPETEEEIRKRLPTLTDHHPRADEVRVEYIFDRDVEPSNSIIRFSEDREVDMIVMSTHGRKGIRRVYIGNNTAEVVRQSRRPVLSMTHPVHKRLFPRPVTEPTVSRFSNIHN